MSGDSTYPKLGRVAVFLGLALPVFLSFNYVYRFTVDAPFWDQWELVIQLERMMSGQLSLSDLFSQHNEHRIFFPRILMLLAARVSGWDTRVEIYLGWLTLLATGAVLLSEHLKTFGRHWGALALFVPLAWLIFTLRQENNLLWGWQIQIFLCGLGLCAAMVLLDSSDQHPWRLAGAVACAAVATFSFASGLGVWPAGVLCLLWRLALVRDPALRRRRLWLLALWCGASAVAFFLYLYGYEKVAYHPSTTHFLSAPGKTIYFLLVVLGAPLSAEPDIAGAASKGLALVVLLLALAYAVRRGWLDAAKASFAIPLLGFAGAAAVMITIGRVGFEGYSTGAASRYTTLTLLGIVGLYRGFLALHAPRLRLAGLSALTLMLFLGVFVTLDAAYAIGRHTRIVRREIRTHLKDYRTSTDDQLRATYPRPEVVRERAAVLERLELSVFRDP